MTTGKTDTTAAAHNNDSIDLQYKSLTLSNLKGFGEKTAQKYAQIGLTNVFDLLFNLPFRYEDKTRVSLISEVEPEGSPALFDLHVIAPRIFNGRRFRVLNARVKDTAGTTINLTFFNPWESLEESMRPRAHLQAYGVLHFDNRGYLSLTNPEVKFLKDNEQVQAEPRFSPVYHLTGKVPQWQMRKFENAALEILQTQPMAELLPEKLNPFGKLTLSAALLEVHKPEAAAWKKQLEQMDADRARLNQIPQPSMLPAFRRLCFEELTAYQLAMLELRSGSEDKDAAAVPKDEALQQKFLQSLPFTPTGAQSRVFGEIMADLAKPHPMFRLVHGDVGSGKTLVALMSMLQVAASGGQSVLLAPTEILARQHFSTICRLSEPTGFKCALLHAGMKAAERRKALQAIASGEAQLIVGTHALLQKDVQYHNLVLAVIDEQHRFGIKQRAALLHKAPAGLFAHQLIMTATPIPRTLQIAMYADLHVSVLDELPKGRSPVITTMAGPERKEKVLTRLEKNLQQGVQAYWVCPLIEDSEDFSLNSVKSTFEMLEKRFAGSGLKAGLLHGQMTGKEKTAVMEQFLHKEINLLVATTIVEVGVDVPNASIMVIDGAQRLGLSQLHQLRGRVGRGSTQSYCLMLYDDLTITDIARQRLQIMCETTNGFTIAEEDLKLRGPGEIFGTRQAGFDIFRLADAFRDADLLEQARACAETLRQQNPEQASKLVNRWFDAQERSDAGEV